MKFTEKEKDYLEKSSYEIENSPIDGHVASVDNSFSKTIIVKDAENEFSYFYDILPNEDIPDNDLERANNNKSVNGLSWQELRDELDIYPKDKNFNFNDIDEDTFDPDFDSYRG